MEKLFALLDLFRKGSVVADPAAIKNGAVGVMAVSALLLALDRVATAFGYPLGITDGVASDVAAGVVAIVGVVSHVVSSEKIGLPPKRDASTADGRIDPLRPDLRG